MKEEKLSFSFSNKRLATNFLKEISIKELRRVKAKKILKEKVVEIFLKGEEKDVEIAKNSIINDYNLILAIRRFLYGE